MIKLDKVTKKYRHKKVLDNISFTVNGGEFVSVVGSSGCGKTTLIHALIGAEPLTSGRITVDKKNITKLKDKEMQDYRRRIGIVFQDYKLLPQKTVFENVSFALEVAGYTNRVIHKRTMNVLKLTGLEDLRNHFPNQLSGGEKQRTAIARALIHAPDLLIADEPTGNLDQENTIALAKLLQKINKHGTTIIISTHDQDVIKILNKRVITLDNGKLISDKKNPKYK